MNIMRSMTSGFFFLTFTRLAMGAIDIKHGQQLQLSDEQIMMNKYYPHHQIHQTPYLPLYMGLEEGRSEIDEILSKKRKDSKDSKTKKSTKSKKDKKKKKKSKKGRNASTNQVANRAATADNNKNDEGDDYYDDENKNDEGDDYYYENYDDDDNKEKYKK